LWLGARILPFRRARTGTAVHGGGILAEPAVFPEPACCAIARQDINHDIAVGGKPTVLEKAQRFTSEPFSPVRALDEELAEIYERVIGKVFILAALVEGIPHHGVLYNDQVLFVARIPRRDGVLSDAIRVGSTVPAVFSSIGKVILSGMSEEELGRTISESSFAGRWGPNAVRTMDELREQLASAREDGYLLQQESAIPGLSSIAAPIRQSGKDIVAALNVAVPTAEYTRKKLLNTILEPLLAASREITLRLGGTY
jgi:hypothetical protein